MSELSPYTLGGTVQAGNGVYIPRHADDTLIGLCRAGTFAYVLTPRQMGKSSLMVRSATTLSEEGVSTVIIDLTQIGVQLTAESWYLGLIEAIEDQLGLDTDVVRWWKEQDVRQIGIVQRLTMFFSKLLLKQVERRIVIFVDEIDTTLSLNFTDDFFAAIRYFYNARAHNPDFRRLSFVLIGVATPGDLIHDAQRTPFNIGQRVDLTDFTLAEADPLRKGLCTSEEASHAALAHVCKWTGGHPYLTQRLCSVLAGHEKESWTASEIDAVVEQTFFGARSEHDNNLQFVRDMLTKRAPDRAGVLELYAQVRKGRRVPDDEQSIVKSHLKLSGVVRVTPGRTMVVSNPIYARVFNPSWVGQHLPINWGRRIQRAAVAAVITLLALNVPLTVYALWQRSVAEQKAIAASTQEQKAHAAATRAESNLKLAKAEKLRATAFAKNAVAAEARARMSLRDAELARAEADMQRQRAEKEAAQLNALRLEREADDKANQGDYVGAQKKIAERMALAERSPAVVRDDPINRALLLDYRQNATLRAVPLWTGKDAAAGPLAFDRTRGRVAAALKDGTIAVYDVQTGDRLMSIASGSSEPTDLRLAFQLVNQTTYLLTADPQRGVFRWDMTASEPAAEPFKELTPVVVPEPLRASGENVPSTPAALSPRREFLTFSPDGRRLVGFEDGRIRIWHLQAQPEKVTSVGVSINSRLPYGRERLSVAFNPDSTRMALASGGRLTEVQPDTGANQDLQSYRMALSYRTPYAAPGLVYGTKDTLYAVTTVGVLDVANQYIQGMPILTAPAVTADGRMVAYVDRDTLQIRDLRAKRTFSPDEDDREKSAPVTAVIAAQQYFATVTAGVVRVWSFAGSDHQTLYADAMTLGSRGILTLSSNGRMRWPDGTVWNIGAGADRILMSPDERFVAAMTGTRQIDLWDVGSRNKLISLGVDTEEVTPRFTPDGKMFVYGWNRDRTLRAFSLDGESLAHYRQHRPRSMDVALSADQSRVLITRAGANLATIADFDDGAALMSFPGFSSSILGGAFNPARKQIATRNLDGTIVLWDTSKEHQPQIIQAHVGPVEAIAYVSSGEFLASAGGTDGLIRIWNVRSGALTRTLKGPAARVTALQFRADGKRLASTTHDGTLRIWSLDDGAELRKFSAPAESRLLSLAWSNDGRTIATGASDGHLRVIDAETGEQLSTTQIAGSGGRPPALHHVVFGAGANAIICGGDDGSLSRWDSGTRTAQLLDNAGSAIEGLAYNAASDEIVYGTSQGRYVVAHGADIRISSEEIGTETLPEAGWKIVDAVAAGPDGRGRFVESDDSELKVRDRANGKAILETGKLDDATGILTPNGKYLLYPSEAGLRLAAVAGEGGRNLDFAGGEMPYAFSADGRLFAYTTPGRHATGIPSNTASVLVHVYDLGANEEIAVVPARGAETIAVDAKAGEVAIREEDSAVKVWSLASAHDLYRRSGSRLVGQIAEPLSVLPTALATTSYDINDIDSRLTEPRRIVDPDSRADAADLASLYKRWKEDQGNAGLKLHIGSELQPYRRLIRSIEAHPTAITGIASAAKSDVLVTTAPEGLAKLWNVSTGQLLKTFDHRNASTFDAGAVIRSVELSDDGRLLLTAGRDGTARLWDTQSGQALHILDTHLSDVVRATFSADEKRILTCSKDGTARIFDAQTGAELHVLRAGESLVSAAFSPDAQHVVTTSRRGSVRLWQVASGDSMELPHPAPAVLAEFSPSGEWLATATTGRVIRIWSASDGKELRALAADKSPTVLRFSPDGNTLLAAGNDRTVRLWNPRTGELIRALYHDANVVAATYSVDGTRVVATTETSKSVVWDVALGRAVAELALPQSSGRSFEDVEVRMPIAQFTRDGNSVVTGGADGALNVWNVPVGDAFRGETDVIAEGLIPSWREPLWKQSDWGTLDVMRYSPDGSRILVAGDANAVRVVSALTGDEILNIPATPESMIGGDWSPDGNFIALASRDGFAAVYDVSSSEPRLKLVLNHEDRVRTVRYSPDGQVIVTVSRDRTARLWSASTGKLLKTLGPHDGYVRVTAFSPDGRRVLTADNTPRLWDVATGALLRTFPSRGAMVATAAFSTNGQRLMTAGFSGFAEVWDVASGQLLFSTPDLGSIEAALLTPDGETIVVETAGGAVSVWNVATKQRTHVLETHEAWAGSLAMSRDGRLIASTSDNGMTTISDRTSGKTIARLRSSVARATTAAFSPDGNALLLSTPNDQAQAFLLPFLSVREEETGHAASVVQAAVSRDGRMAATIDSRGELSTSDLQAKRTRSGAIAADVQAVAWTSDGELLTVSKVSREEWRFVRGDSIGATIAAQIPLERVSAGSISRSGKFVAVARHDGTVEICDARTGRVARQIRVSPDIIVVAWINDDGTRLVVRDHSRHITIWNVTTAKKLFDAIEISGDLAFSADGRRMIAGLDLFTPSIIDIDRGQKLLDLRGATGALRSVHYSTASDRILVIHNDGSARVWDANAGTLLRKFDDPAEKILYGDISPDGTHLVLAGTRKIGNEEVRMGAIRVVDSGIEIADISTREDSLGWIWFVKYTANGQRVATLYSGLSRDNPSSIRVWDATNGRIISTFTKDDGGGEVVFTPDGKEVLTHNAVSGGITVWNVETGQTTRRFRWNGPTDSVQMSTGGLFLASVQNALQVWDLTGYRVRTFEPGRALALTSNGLRLAVSASDGSLSIRDLSTSASRMLDWDGNTIGMATFDSDGKKLIVGDAAGRIAVWDVDTGSRITSMHEEGTIVSIGFGPDPGHVFSARSDGTVNYWPLDGLSTPKSLSLGTPTRTVALDATRKLLAVATGRSVTIYPVETNEPVSTFKWRAEVTTLTFTPDGSLVGGDQDGSVVTWILPSFEFTEADLTRALEVTKRAAGSR